MADSGRQLGWRGRVGGTGAGPSRVVEHRLRLALLVVLILGAALVLAIALGG
ncbi:hypothetical protein ACTXG6_13815 [Pseudonocardia sp. Cha107L01]|uniref:hypothetical protein n=1 Tax=Pseudonocardia sp. Cha107L01 TaxID=3457576 RepID=UPI00403E9748